MSLIENKKPDNFTTESPIRAFTDFQVAGRYAIGKGFRPSLAHLSRYLNAMENKEGWALAQIILPENDAGDPTIVFRKTFRTLIVNPSMEVASAQPPLPTGSDATDLNQIDNPLRPKHYGGTQCAEIGELLTANSFQVLRYNWRLGKKDEAVQELGKGLFYLEREIHVGSSRQVYVPNTRLPPAEWFEQRLVECDDYVRSVAWRLIDWNRTGVVLHLTNLRLLMVSRKRQIENAA